MKFKTLGKTGIQASVLGLGAMRLPKLEDGTCDYEKAVPIVRHGLDAGITYIDSAHGYLNGTSEVAVGKGIKGYDRSKLVIATKIPSNDEEPAKGDVWRSKFDLTMQRVDSPYLDFIMFHSLRWDAFSERISRPGMALDAAHKAQAEGLVRHLGFSCHDSVDNIKKLIDTSEFAMMLVQYNYLDRHNEPVIAYAAEKGMGVVVMGPIAGGRLAMPGPATSGDAAEVKATELALRFVWNNPGVTVALSGMSNDVQIDENVQAADRNAAMSASERTQILHLVEKNQKLADLYCTGCGYCVPCPHEVNIPENFRYMNWLRVWGLEADAKKAYANLGPNGTWTQWAGKIDGLNADACQKCGECEPKCPQNIPIIMQLEEVAATLGKQ